MMYYTRFKFEYILDQLQLGQTTGPPYFMLAYGTQRPAGTFVDRNATMALSVLKQYIPVPVTARLLPALICSPRYNRSHVDHSYYIRYRPALQIESSTVWIVSQHPNHTNTVLWISR
jgi:hypothetical protein